MFRKLWLIVLLCIFEISSENTTEVDATSDEPEIADTTETATEIPLDITKLLMDDEKELQKKPGKDAKKDHQKNDKENDQEKDNGKDSDHQGRMHPENPDDSDIPHEDDTHEEEFVTKSQNELQKLAFKFNHTNFEFKFFANLKSL